MPRKDEQIREKKSNDEQVGRMEACEKCRKGKRRCKHKVPLTIDGYNTHLDPVTGEVKRAKKQDPCDACKKARYRCTHHDEDKEPPEPPLQIGNTSKVDKPPASFDYKYNTFHSHHDREATPFDEPVSTALDTLRLNATIIPPGLQDSAGGRTISASAGFLPTFNIQSLTLPFQYSYEGRGAASLQIPTRQYSNIDSITGAEQSRPSQYQYSYGRSGDAGRLDPTQRYSYPDSISDADQSLGLGGPDPSFYFNRDTTSYLQPPPPQQPPDYQGSGPQNESSEESSQSESEEDSIVKIGHDRFVSSRNYLGSKEKNRCTGRGFPPSHQDDDYGAPGSHKPLGGAPSPHAIENFEAWRSKALEAAAKEASTSSGKSQSPAHHEERREREKERERKDQPAKSRGSTSGGGSKQKTDKGKDNQPAKSRGSTSGGGSKQKTDKDNQPATSHRKKSGGSSKPKDTSKNDTRGGGRRRERQR